MAGAGQRGRIFEDQSSHQESMTMFLLGSGHPKGGTDAEFWGIGPSGMWVLQNYNNIHLPGDPKYVALRWEGQGGAGWEESLPLQSFACDGLPEKPNTTRFQPPICLLHFLSHFSWGPNNIRVNIARGTDSKHADLVSSGQRKQHQI